MTGTDSCNGCGNTFTLSVLRYVKTGATTGSGKPIFVYLCTACRAQRKGK